jgi:pyruvate dehydrogenase (quinone)
MGRALPHDERQTAAPRVVQPRLDGNALPQAIGAQATFPGRQVVSLSGDGGFSMLMGDFLSLAQLQLPVKVVVYDNSSLAFVAIEMKANGFLDTRVDLKNPDFAAMARAVGIKHSRRAVRRRRGRPARGIRAPRSRARRSDDREAGVVMPPKIEVAQAKDFSLFMLKAIINSRGDEIVELAETNLGR